MESNGGDIASCDSGHVQTTRRARAAVLVDREEEPVAFEERARPRTSGSSLISGSALQIRVSRFLRSDRSGTSRR